MTLNGNSDETNGYNTVVKNGESPNINLVKAILPPIGTIMQWCKTYGTADSGTTDGTTASKLVDSSQNFTITTNKTMVIHNTTDDTWTYATAIDSNTIISVNDDIFVSGESYVIYKTPNLPDGWVECDGTVLSDSDSPFNGETLPDLNVTQRFLRGSDTSGTTGGEDTHVLTEAEMPDHNHSYTRPTDSSNMGSGSNYNVSGLDGGGTTGGKGGDGAHENKPAFYEVVMIMRIK